MRPEQRVRIDVQREAEPLAGIEVVEIERHLAIASGRAADLIRRAGREAPGLTVDLERLAVVAPRGVRVEEHAVGQNGLAEVDDDLLEVVAALAQVVQLDGVGVEGADVDAGIGCEDQLGDARLRFGLGSAGDVDRVEGGGEGRAWPLRSRDDSHSKTGRRTGSR
ncbi:hypothetical protein EMGR_008380 [Emarellia grisea]